MPRHVFIIGCKGIPSNYGGFETFVDKLTEYNEKLGQGISYHVACMGETEGRFTYHDADCFRVKVAKIGPARAPLYDIKAIKQVLKYLKAHPEIENPIVYVLACRIGPFMKGFAKKIHRAGGSFYLNPDGHEWMRSKWSRPVRKYWKWSEKLMVKQADLCICDSKNIEKYIRETYAEYKPETTFIAYGADTAACDSAEAAEEAESLGKSSEKSGEVRPTTGERLTAWLAEQGLQRDEYYLIVGRFVPENNYETVVREFMASHSRKKLAIITTENDKLKKQLKERLHYDEDPRICFVGTVYDQALLVAIRRNAYGYFHGHEVGGTNPSLLEALSCTRLNLVLDVGFNREVAEDAGLYWTKEKGNLAGLIDAADGYDAAFIRRMDEASTERIRSEYSWEAISEKYHKVFER